MKKIRSYLLIMLLMVFEGTAHSEVVTDKPMISNTTEGINIEEPSVESKINEKVKADIKNNADIKLKADLNSDSDFDEAQINYKAQDEESVPILTQQKTKVEEQSGAMYKSIVSVFVLLLLGGIGLWYLKRKALMTNGTQTLMQIKVLTQFHLAPRKTLMVVRVAGESLLLGVTENQICLLKNLSLLDEDLPESTPKNFNQTMAKTDVHSNEIQPPKNTVLKSPEFGDSDEEFAFGNIKHLVENKLKSMKRW